MEKRNEKWESLKLKVQQFTPQEYVANCYVLHLQCDGFPLAENGQYQDHIFQGTEASSTFYADISHEMPHDPHPVGDYFYVGDTPPTLDDITSQIHEFPSIVAAIAALNHHGTNFVGGKEDQYSVGFCFPTIPGANTQDRWSYCFVKTLNWELKGYGDGPNAS